MPSFLHAEHFRLFAGDSPTPLMDGGAFDLPAGLWTAILGPSGVGKTSLLDCLAALPWCRYEGVLRFQNDAVPSVAYLSQKESLFPWLNVLDNICLSRRLRPVDGAADGQRILERLGLGGLGDRPLQSLSGGERQRVALGAVLFENPDLILMDEPFGALDALNRRLMQSLSFEVFEGKTVVLVTHDPLEALRLGHKIFVMTRAKGLQALEPPAGPPLRDFGGAEAAAFYNRLLQELGQDFSPAKPQAAYGGGHA